MSSPFTIAVPSARDASRIAAIHVASMDTNPLLHAQFPTPEAIASLVTYLTDDTIRCLSRGNNGALVARDEETGEIASFAKWDVLNVNGGGHDTSAAAGPEDEVWPTECVREYIETYSQLAEGVKAKVMGNRACYRLTFVCTDARWRGRGAATALMERVLHLATVDGLPIYLESTLNAVGLYKRCGFEAVDGFQMALPSGEMYEEVCMLWTPPASDGSGA